jgi:hypothetical protein
MQGLGFEKILIFIVPGMIVGAGVAMLLTTYLPSSGPVRDYFNSVLATDARFVFWALAISTFFGGLVRSAGGTLEALLLDGRAARILNIRPEEFSQQWSAYIDSLDGDKGNAYICGFRKFWHRYSRKSGTVCILRDSGLEFQVPCSA